MAEPSPLQMIPHARNVPMAPFIDTYARFGIDSYVPNEYTGFLDESMSWKQTCYIGDWSPLWKLMVTGPDALRFFSDLSVNSFDSMEIGRGKDAIFCNQDGKLTGDGVFMRLGEERFFYQSGPGAPWAQFMFGQGKYNA